MSSIHESRRDRRMLHGPPAKNGYHWRHSFPAENAGCEYGVYND